MSDPTAAPATSPGPLTRRPAVVVALLLAMGILLHDQVPMTQRQFWIVAAATAMLTAGFLQRRFLGAIGMSLLILLLGIGLARREHFQFSSVDIALFAGDEPHLTEIEVRLLNDPEVVVGPAIGQRVLPPKQAVTGDVRRIKTQSGWTAVSGQLPITIEQIQPELAAGQTVRMLGMLERPRQAANPGEFDWAWYYRQQRILTTFTVTRAGNIYILADSGPSALGWLRVKARHLLSSGFTTAHATDCALLDALLLGHRDPELRDIQDEFKQTGMGYQLSVSGMHIALLAGAVFAICSCFCLRPRITLAITTGFVLLYAGISLPSHSGVRGAILCVAVAAAACTARPTDTRQLLSLAVIAMLLWHPMDIYSVGFQLSFAVSIAFVLLPPALQGWLDLHRDPHDAAKPIDRNPTFPQRLRSWIWFCVEYGSIAWLATLPLVAYHFGQASTWSILGSLLLFPFIAMALFAGLLKVLLTMVWPRLAGIFAIVAGWPVQVVRWGVHEMSGLPGSPVVLPAPALWLIVVYYLLLLAPLLPHWSMLSGRRRWLVRLAPLLGVIAIFSSSRWQSLSTVGPPELRLTLLSLGAGQCAVLEPPGGLPVLLDAGSTTVSDVARKIIEPFLRARGESRVDEIFLSHGDFDHISAAGEITADYDVREVFTSFHFIRNSTGNIPDQLLLDELEKLNRTPLQISVGDHFDLGHGVGLDVLWPPKVGDLNSNNAGLVLRVTYAGRSLLFPADIQDPAFIGVLKNARALRSDVLIAPHHGSSENLTPAFLAAVHPQIILSSNFGRLTSKQRRFETMTNHVPLYRTPECGAITVTIGKDGRISVSTYVKGAKPEE